MSSTTSPLVAAQPHPDGPGYPEPMTTAPGLPTTDLSHAQPHCFVATLAVLDPAPTRVVEVDAAPLLQCGIAC
jgi:hypothetical protein